MPWQLNTLHIARILFIAELYEEWEEERNCCHSYACHFMAVRAVRAAIVKYVRFIIIFITYTNKELLRVEFGLNWIYVYELYYRKVELFRNCNISLCAILNKRVYRQCSDNSVNFCQIKTCCIYRWRAKIPIYRFSRDFLHKVIIEAREVIRLFYGGIALTNLQFKFENWRTTRETVTKSFIFRLWSAVNKHSFSHIMLLIISLLHTRIF